MKKNTKSTKIVNSFKNELKSKSKKILNFMSISVAIFISYLASISFILIHDIEKNILIFSFFLFIASTLVLFNLIRNFLKKLVYKNNNFEIYFLFSLILIAGVILTFLVSSYYMNLYFKTSVFDRAEYLKNYDLKAKDTMNIFLPTTLGIGLLTFFVYKVYTSKKKLKSGLIETLKLFFNLSVFYLITFIIGFIILIMINLSGPGPFGG